MKFWHPSMPARIWEIAVKKDLMDSRGRQMLAVSAGWKNPVYRYYLPIYDKRPNHEEGYRDSALIRREIVLKH